MKPTEFDPNAKSSHEGIFGLPFGEQEAELILLPVPWEPSTSYGGGTARGPSLILHASHQVDLFDLDFGKAYEAGIHMRPIPKDLLALSDELKKEGSPVDRVNEASDLMTNWVRQQSAQIRAKGKIPAVVGGDHSTPLGLIRTLAEELKGDLGILHIDAHADLRNAYEGYRQSHASIMYNVLQLPVPPQKLVQVGIRDFCEEEFLLIQKEKTRVRTYFDGELKQRQYQGDTWLELVREIISHLPQNVYVSFDIDGLDPALCPNTGTPVPGGLQFTEAMILIREIVKTKRRIVGFDLNEVSDGGSNNEWNGNVGARVLYKLCGWTLVSQR